MNNDWTCSTFFDTKVSLFVSWMESQQSKDPLLVVVVGLTAKSTVLVEETLSVRQAGSQGRTNNESRFEREDVQERILWWLFPTTTAVT